MHAQIGTQRLALKIHIVKFGMRVCNPLICAIANEKLLVMFSLEVFDTVEHQSVVTPTTVLKEQEHGKVHDRKHVEWKPFGILFVRDIHCHNRMVA
jgi:hypothetical protein